MKFESITSRMKPAPPESLRVITVHPGELPLHCPRKADNQWSMHPRVYIPLQQSETGEVACPYCGNVYQLNQAS